MEPRTPAIPMWIAEKDGRQVVCEVVSWPHGVDLRAWANGELYRTQLCRDGIEMTFVQAEWRAKLEADGWTTEKLSPGWENAPTDPV